jgi:hypothetical protein
MLRIFAIVIAGAAIFASLPLTNARACDDDRYPCPIRSEVLIVETDQAPDQVAPDQQQKKSAQPQKKAKAPTNEKAHAKRDREAPRTTASAKVSKPAVPKQAPDASQKALEAAPAAVASPRADQQPLNDESRGGSVLATAGTWLNYLLWTLGAALAAAFAMWFFSRMRSLFGRRTANAAEPLMK